MWSIGSNAAWRSGERKGLSYGVWKIIPEPCEMRKVAGQVTRDERGLSGETGQIGASFNMLEREGKGGM